MRLSFAVTLAALAFAVPAQATDFDSQNFGVFGQRAAPIVVYDYQPGVRVRAYWLAPWRNRHYFPTTGIIPESGRDEDLNAPRQRLEPAPSFYREWSTSSYFGPQPQPVNVPAIVLPPAPDDDAAPVPMPRQREIPQRFEPLPPAAPVKP